MSYFDPKRGQTLGTDASGVAVDSSFIAHFNVPAAAAPSAASVLAATVLTDAAQAIKTNITNPATPRSVSVTGNASGIVGTVTVKGTNHGGKAITEELTLNGTATVEGNKAFATVTEIDLPIQTHAGTDTVSVGTGSKLGLPYLLAHNTVLATYLDNVKESTPPAVTTDAANLENNTIDLSSALAGKTVDAYLLV